jgi:hypothetical protein
MIYEKNMLSQNFRFWYIIVPLGANGLKRDLLKSFYCIYKEKCKLTVVQYETYASPLLTIFVFLYMFPITKVSNIQSFHLISNEFILLITFMMTCTQPGTDYIVCDWSHYIFMHRTEDEEQFELAQSLAERYHVPLSHMAVARLSHMLLGESSCSKEKILAAVADLEQYLDGDTVIRWDL